MNQTLEKLKSVQNTEEAEFHMRTYRFFADEQIRIREISSGSIVWILVFESIDSLDVFWNEYLSGHLKEMFEKDFITNDLLKSAELESAEIQIYVSEQDFKTCQEELKGWFVIYIMIFYNASVPKSHNNKKPKFNDHDFFCNSYFQKNNRKHHLNLILL